MNKQFLSLLLLTSFVETMSAGVPAVAAGIYGPAAAIIGGAGLGYFGNKMTESSAAELAAKGAKLAARNADTVAEMAQAKLVQASIDITNRIAARKLAEAAAARPWYTKASEAFFAKAYSAKDSVVAGSTAAFEYAKVNRGKTAGMVIGAGVLGYLAYKGYNKLMSPYSLSLNEQQKVTLRTALTEASALRGCSNVWAVRQPEQLQHVEHFTSEKTGLSRAVVNKLNQFVTLDDSYKGLKYLCDHQNGLTNPATAKAFADTKLARDAKFAELQALVPAA